MQVESQRSRIDRSSDWARRNQDEERKDKRSIRLADFEKSQRYIEIFRTN